MAEINGYQNGLSNTLMRVSGGSSKTTYTASFFSDATTDVIRIDFNDTFRGNFRTAYDPTNEAAGQVGFRPEIFLSPTTQSVYDVVKHFRVKQIDGATGNVVAEGIPLRWIPPSSGDAGGGTLFIKVLFHQSEDPTAFSAANGVIFCSEVSQFEYPIGSEDAKIYPGNPMSYGSNIRSITNLTNVYKLVSKQGLDEQTGSQVDCGDDFNKFNIGRGLYASGDRVFLKTSIDDACESTYAASGTVISVAIDSNSGLLSIFVEFDEELPDTTGNSNLGNCSPGGNDECPSDLLLCNGSSSGYCGASCAIYGIQSIKKISAPNCGTVQKIVFGSEKSSTGGTEDYVPGQEIYQWKYENCGNHPDNGQFYTSKSDNSLAKIVGEYIHWAKEVKTLYVLCPGSIMEIKYGNVYQNNNGNLFSYGSGVMSSSRFQRRTGSFVNIKNTEGSPTYIPGQEYEQSWENTTGGESLFQLLSVNSTGYNPEYDYNVGETVVQILNETFDKAENRYVVSEYSAGKVLAWEPNTTALPNVPSVLKIKRAVKGPANPLYYDLKSLWPPENDLVDLQQFRYGPGISPDIQGGNGSLVGNTQRNILPFRVLSGIDVTQPAEPWYDFSNTSVKQIRVLDKGNLISNAVPNGLEATDSSVGTARLKALQFDSVINVAVPLPDADGDGIPDGEEIIQRTLYKAHLMDVEIDKDLVGNVSFKDITGLGVRKDGDVTEYLVYLHRPINPTTGLEESKIYEPGFDKQIYPLPGTEAVEKIKEYVANKEITVQKIYDVTFTSQTYILNVNDSDNTIPDAEFPSVLSNSNFINAIKQDGTLVQLNQIAWPGPPLTPTGNSTLNYQIVKDASQNNKQITFIRNPSVTNPITRIIFTTDVKVPIDSVIKNKKQKYFTKDVRLIYQPVDAAIEDLALSGKYAGKWIAVLQSGPSTSPDIVYNLTKLISVFALDGTEIISENVASYFDIEKEVDDYVYRPSIIWLNTDGVETNISGTPANIPILPKFGHLIQTDGDGNYWIDLKVSGLGWDIPNTPGIILRESYLDYNNTKLDMKSIPLYVSGVDGQKLHPSAFFDCRGFVDGNSLDQNVRNTKFVPIPSGSIVNTKLDTYLPRYDYLYIGKNGGFKIAYGKSSFQPEFPPLPEDGMILYKIKKPSVVFDYNSISLYYTDNRRYTMRDIGRIDKRVSQLETYTALSLLEKSADSLLIEDVNGNNRFKNGIIVDPFNSLKLGDVAHPDYYAAIDTNESCLRPIAIPTNLSLNLVTTGGATTFVPISNAECGVIIEEGTGQLKPLNTVLAEGDEPAGLLPLPVASGLYMMPYTQEPFVVQPMATRAMTLTPFEVVNLEGKVQLIPKEDDWVDVERMPDLNIDFAGNNDVWNDIVNAINDAKAGPFALKYGEWQTYSTQLTNETRTTWRERLGAHKARNNTRITRTYENNQTRTVHQDQLTTSTEEVSLGDRVVDVNIIPYMRGRRIRVIVTGLKTNSRIYPFFDGQDVSQYCYLYPTPQEFVEQYRQTVLDEDYKFTNTANGFKKTTNTGLALIIFDMPDGIFRTGDRKFSVSDHPNNDITRATTFASGVYSANGLSQVRQSTNGTIRDFDKIYDVQLPNEEQIVITTQDIIINGTPFHIDPLAQTFTINKALYPNGIYLTSVDIFFARKPDNSTNIPVEVQIRPTVNAFPDAYKIHPGARAILHPSQVKVSDNPQTSDLENTATRFNFDTPVYLEPGEHALVVKSTTAEYEIYIGEIGQNLLNTTTRVVEQPYMGVFFASSNATTWLPKPEMDMMMILNKAVFPVNSAKKLTCESSPNSTVLKYETLNFSSSYQEFDQCKVGWEVSEDGGNQWTVITPNENIDYNETKSIAAQTGKLMFRATATTTDPNVSPIINVDRLSAFVVKNIIENGFTDPDELLPFATHYADNINEFKRTRYITRIVTLEEGFEATGFKMLLAVNKPAGTKIKVFLKYQPMEETRDFHINPWVELVPDMGVTEFDNYSTPNSGVYIDVPFAYLNSDGLNDTLSQYNKFAIKICLYAPNAAIVPKVTDLRGIAVL